MFDNTETLQWPILARPYGEAERALGRLAQALDITSLFPTWLWREISRTAITIAQASGHQAKLGPLRMTLIGAPIDPEDNTTGLAAAKRVFINAVPLFRANPSTDSDRRLWPEFWTSQRLDGGGEPPEADDQTPRPGSEAILEGEGERDRLRALVRELAGFADDGRRPALINLFVDLRRHAATKRLSPSLMRLVLPLALAEAGLLPKPAPGLLGGRRLSLGMSAASTEAKPLTDWLVSGLEALAKEAQQSHRRLMELMRQHRAWHATLAEAGLRRHARAPAALDLLAATPVLSIGLVAHHLGCSHVAAGKIIERLCAFGILIEQTSRSRHKVFVAGDLSAPSRGELDLDQPLALSKPAPAIDVDALGATLDGLFADLDRLNERAKGQAREGG